jgi:hypothetical protein
MAIQNLDKVN